MAEIQVEWAEPEIDVRVMPSIPIPGPPGPPGPPGDSSAVLGYVHTQNTPSSLWTITHPLPYVPNVIVTDSSGKVVWTDVTYVSATVIHIGTAAPFAGIAYLS